MKRVSILGVTGSIGANTVEVIEATGGAEVVAVTGHSNIAGLAAAARRLGAEVAVTADPARFGDLRDALSGSGIAAAAGPEALVEAASRPADWVMSAIVGAAGLAPTLAAVRAGATIALANKECLVAAGSLFLGEIERSGARLLPVDSEHNAIFQCLAGERAAQVERLILTASGGPFRNRSAEQMAAVTVAEAVAHPNWSMGQRISIDSASMFNKALEMIEAWHLFPVAPAQVEVIVHPQSIIHSMVGFADGSILAHLGPADMRVAIGHALTWPDRARLPVERLDFAALSRLDFEAPDPARFPALGLARRAMERGGVAGCVMNGAREVALDAFIAGQIGFLDMARLVESAMEALDELPAATDLTDIFAADAEARRIGRGLVPRFAA
ncbi:1-deoxy-D-xylulose-5-phosphate reductoisomerase [Paralimibaculum aggregatum]|uniref:1-deoxy-D-xylulose 5-phosphate reductoisomerase n=1 Tax=Paralimibaculum aggregatum TaxID=3036245 RepID=A0ABQ6LK77_9RHOB|nr:1-deoxy-D-xylulose-5-phosphate reductoisomerase [Limibaculum sp. NKW23]GMG83657.1 1-deoxy-D-xylulose-5-phosphate reductoisomerase [Limibaculum sp. NKW23]